MRRRWTHDARAGFPLSRTPFLEGISVISLPPLSRHFLHDGTHHLVQRDVQRGRTPTIWLVGNHVEVSFSILALNEPVMLDTAAR